MIKFKKEEMGNSTRIIPDDSYAVRIKQADDSFIYSIGYAQIPNARIDEVFIDSIPVSEIPEEPTPDE